MIAAAAAARHESARGVDTAPDRWTGSVARHVIARSGCSKDEVVEIAGNDLVLNQFPKQRPPP